MRRHVLRLSQLAIDMALLALAFAIAFLMRFDWRPPADMLGRLALTVPYIVVGEYLVLWLFGVPKSSWRYVGLREVWRILAAAVTANVLILWTRITFGALQDGRQTILNLCQRRRHRRHVGPIRSEAEWDWRRRVAGYIEQ